MTSTAYSVSSEGTLPNAPNSLVHSWHNFQNKASPAQCYQDILQRSNSDVIIYLHDDVTIHDEDWMTKIMTPFLWDDDCVAVGFGGATGLGNADLYRKPYNIWNLARTGYRSNQTDAEVHGLRETGIVQVAVLDAFCMAVKREWLLSRQTYKHFTTGRMYGIDDIGHHYTAMETGWPVSHLTHHCLDLWLGCEAARDGKKIFMTGVSCTHHGGGTSTKDSYKEAGWLQGGTMEDDHRIPHEWIQYEYRGVLPIQL